MTICAASGAQRARCAASMDQRRQERGLRGAVGEKAQRGGEHAAVELDLERQPLSGSSMVSVDFLRAEFARAAPSRSSLQVGIGGGAIRRLPGSAPR